LRDKQFETLEQSGHRAHLRGERLHLRAATWDDARRKFVDKLKALGVPLLVLVIVRPGQGISGAVDRCWMHRERSGFWRSGKSRRAARN